MPTCRCLAQQNWLLWQPPLTEVHQICSYMNLFINGVNATIRVKIRAHIVGATVKNIKSSVKHKPAGGIAMPAGRASKLTMSVFYA